MKTNYNVHILKLKHLLILCLLCAIAACKKSEEKLTPTETPEYGYRIPQGNNSFDQRIVKYYNRWKTYILYKFTEQDFTWAISKYDKTYKGVGADEAYIDKQLDLLDSTFFKYYEDSTLAKYLPLKFFLCSSLTEGSGNKRVDAYLLTGTNLGGYESFAVNWGNKGILNISSPIDSVPIFRSNVNYSFLKMMDLRYKMGRSDVFLGSSDYVTTQISPTAPATTLTAGDYYKRGFLVNASSSSLSTQTTSAQNDWFLYLQIILSNSYATLIDPNTTPTDRTAKGILSSVKDQTGMIRRKYDAMTAFYKEVYNIDIQKIGDGR